MQRFSDLRALSPGLTLQYEWILSGLSLFRLQVIQHSKLGFEKDAANFVLLDNCHLSTLLSLLLFLQVSSSSIVRPSTRAPGLSSREAVFPANEGAAARPDTTIQKGGSGRRASPVVSSDHHNLESAIKKIEGLNVSNEERLH